MILQKVIILLFVIAIVASEEQEDDSITTYSRKERFLLATLKFRNRICGTQTDTRSGVCKSWKDCWTGRGTSIGSCTLGHGVCCQYVYTCGNSTSERLSYFKSPTVVPSLCSLRVNVYDKRVTQLRLDFLTFRLAQPTKNNNTFDAYHCYNDSFTVVTSSGLYSNLGFQNLCGENSGQHIYVPVNATLGPASVDLYFNTANRANNPGLINPEWNIKITQIDCCAPDTKDLCAPAGCLQYYPDPSGSFQSFNYNGGAGHYQGLLNYAICFKRYDTVCSIQYTANGFQLPANDFREPYPLPYFACDAPTPSDMVDSPFSRDYLFIPDATQSPIRNASLWCGISLTSGPVTTYAPGPLYVFFRTDNTANEVGNGDEIGFNIRYQESSSGCYPSQSLFG